MSDNNKKGLEKELMCMNFVEAFGRVLCARPNLKCEYISLGGGYELEPVHLCTKYDNSNLYERNLDRFGIMLNLGSNIGTDLENVKKTDGKFALKVSGSIYNKDN